MCFFYDEFIDIIFKQNQDEALYPMTDKRSKESTNTRNAPEGNYVSRSALDTIKGQINFII
jgi:hypothetical protein